MARRDLDIEIGAETDEQSFRQAERKTKGFLSRLRSDTGDGRGREQVSGLERSSRVLATLGQAAAVVAALEAAASGVEASFSLAAAFSKEAAGDLEAANQAFKETFESARQLPLGLGSVVRLFESVESQVTGQQTLRELYEGSQRINAEFSRGLAETAKRLETISRLQKRNEVEARLFGKEGIELEIERARIAAESRQEEIQGIAKSRRERQILQSVADETAERDRANIERISQRESERQEDEAAQRRRDRARRISDIERQNAEEQRAFRLQGVELEIERSRIASESRIAELEAQKRLLGFSFERFRIQKVINDTLRRQAEIESRIRSRARTQSESPALGPLPLPQGTTSLLISGVAQQAAAGQSLEVRMAQTAEETKDNTAETVEALRQILQAVNTQNASPAFIN